MKRQKAFQWSRLDNAAKIFPPTSNARDPKVIRFACELTELVQPEPLQMALDETLEQFPFYRSVLKKGMFWYYLEATDLAPRVAPEEQPPCEPLYRGDGRNLLFRVSWYRRRINLEVYHALSDGTGALHFLRMLVYHYLVRVHAQEFEEAIPAIDYDASNTQKMDDSFLKYYARERKAPPELGPRAYHLRAERLADCRLSIVEGALPVKKALGIAHEYGATLTVFLTSVLIQAIHSQMSLRDERRPVVVTVPVNLRNYFPSATARNFFSVVNVGYDFSARSGELTDIIDQVGRTFSEELTEEKLARRMNRLAALEHTMLIRVIPLMLKIPVLRLSNWVAEREITASFSNIGKIEMPAQLARLIRRFDVFLSTQRLQVCMSSFGEELVITFTTPFVSPDVQRSFFRILSGMGLCATVTTNFVNVEGAG